jgi:hypothetical protein
MTQQQRNSVFCAVYTEMWSEKSGMSDLVERWGKVPFQEPGVKGTFAVGSCYKRTGEDTVDWEDSHMSYS